MYEIAVSIHSSKYLKCFSEISHFNSDHSITSTLLLLLLATTHLHSLTYSSSHLHLSISSLFSASTYHLHLGLAILGDVRQNDLQIYLELALHRGARNGVCGARNGVCHAPMAVCCAHMESLRSHGITALT